MKPFREKVLEIVKRIPRGGTLSYRDVAFLAGSPRAYRTVGAILKTNFDPVIPCHRVIRADGTLGQYNRGADQKRLLLESEHAI